MLNLDTGGRDWVLSLLGPTDFVDSPRRVLHPLRIRWVVEWGEVGVETGRKTGRNWD